MASKKIYTKLRSAASINRGGNSKATLLTLHGFPFKKGKLKLQAKILMNITKTSDSIETKMKFDDKYQ